MHLFDYPRKFSSWLVCPFDPDVLFELINSSELNKSITTPPEIWCWTEKNNETGNLSETHKNYISFTYHIPINETTKKKPEKKYLYSLSSIQEKSFAFRPAAAILSSIQSDIL